MWWNRMAKPRDKAVHVLYVDLGILPHHVQTPPMYEYIIMHLSGWVLVTDICAVAHH